MSRLIESPLVYQLVRHPCNKRQRTTRWVNDWVAQRPHVADCNGERRSNGREDYQPKKPGMEFGNHPASDTARHHNNRLPARALSNLLRVSRRLGWERCVFSQFSEARSTNQGRRCDATIHDIQLMQDATEKVEYFYQAERLVRKQPDGVQSQNAVTDYS